MTHKIIFRDSTFTPATIESSGFQLMPEGVAFFEEITTQQSRIITSVKQETRLKAFYPYTTIHSVERVD